MSDATIIECSPVDAEELTQLTIRSKAFWDYSSDQISEWIEDLTISEDYIRDNFVFKLMKSNTTLGFYAYNFISPEDIKLNYLFVEPKWIRNGYGKMLLLDFLRRIKGENIAKVVLDADPNAEAFYKHLGFVVIGQLPSSIEGRTLPIMELKKTDIRLKTLD